MTRKLILTALVAALGSAPFPTRILGQVPSATTHLASAELDSMSLATSTPLTPLSLLNERGGLELAPPLLNADTGLNPEKIHVRSARHEDAAEQLGNWLVVAGFGLSFTAGLIITIAMTRPSTELPRLVL